MQIRRAGTLALIGLTALSLGCGDSDATTGTLVVIVDGLPAGAVASFTVTGPGGFSKSLPATGTLDKLVPGDYVVATPVVKHLGGVFTTPKATNKVPVTAGSIASLSVSYANTTGSINLTATGLPAGGAPRVTLTGPTGLPLIVSQAGLIGELAPGSYELRADTILAGLGDAYAPSTVIKTVTVAISTTPTDVQYTYALASGTIDLTVPGLATGVRTTPVTITTPNGTLIKANQATTLRGLRPGTYSVDAVDAELCPNIYSPTVAHQSISVSVGVTTDAAVTFSASQPAASALNLKITGMQLLQVVQDSAGTAPIVADRPAKLRLWVTANQCNSTKPKVRISLGGNALADIPAQSDTVPRAFDWTNNATAYTFDLAADAVVPGLSLVAEVDPDNAVAEANEADNRFPAVGSYAPDVQRVKVGVLVIPVSQNISGQNVTGSVSAATVESFFPWARKMHPVSQYNVTLRSTAYSTSAPILQAQNGNNAWTQIVVELYNLETADSIANPSVVTRYYMGVVQTSYANGVTGIGLIGHKASVVTSIGGVHQWVVHELGHNFGRQHAPCGTLAFDAGYPFPDGRIGALGFDFADATYKGPSTTFDFMSYCTPSWTSVYSYKGMFSWILEHPSFTGSPPGDSAAALIVWGRIKNGVPVLEPGYEVTSRVVLRPTSGPNTLTFRDASGTTIASMHFTAARISEPSDEEAFAVAVPLSLFGGRQLASVTATTPRGSASMGSSGVLGAGASIESEAVSNSAVRLKWDAGRFPMLVVRDPASGDILSFARGGNAVITTSSATLSIKASNRVGSVDRLIRVR